ncbi:alpha-L-rhamnosidase N-terminal domain-containing protein, partial [Streptomyces sp. NPDC056730]|uniref:glycoside hydrolase family 78 protein n=1 Tax=Streptomyces sp. NPDC056730 TaxID=3345929 RepID=UPI003697B733
MGWTRRGLLHTSVAGAGVGIAGLAAASPAAGAPSGGSSGTGGRRAGLRVATATVEYTERLLGTDVAAPLLSWELSGASDARGARQSAYQIRAANDPRALAAGRQLLWDTGRVASDRTVAVPYAGPGLPPRTRCHWQVRVWDGDGRVSPWSTAGWWETALGAEPWQARWIGADQAPEPPGFDGASWIWTEGATTGGAPVGARWFRGALALPPGTRGTDVARATLLATADDDFTLHLDGRQVLHAPEQVDGWRTGQMADVTEAVRSATGGRIVLAALAANRGAASVNPAGLLVRLLVETVGGTRHELVTGAGWRAAGTAQQGWEQPDFDDSGWTPAAVLAPYGQGPWGTGVSIAAPEAPAPLLRREFTVSGPVSRARLYISGLAYYTAELNGKRIGGQVLDPAFTDYDETVLYAVHDVTSLLRRGANAIGVTLGRGFYGMTTPNVWT